MSKSIAVLEHPATDTAAHGDELRAWRSALLVATARAYVAFIGTLVMVAVLPALLGWHSYVIRSGSMAPTLQVGDVVVASPLDEHAELPLGRVMVFLDPARSGDDSRTLVHRIIAENDDHSYTSAGDANRKWDTTPVPRAAVKGLARLRVPWVGLPVVWWAAGDLWQLATAVAVTALALVVVARDQSQRRRPPRGDPSGAATHLRSLPERRMPQILGRAITTVAALTACVFVGTASAAFSAETVNPGNAWAVTTRYLLPYRTNVLADSPWGFYETEEASGGTANDTSGNNRHGSYGGTITYRQVGSLTRVPGYSVLLGSSGRLIAATTTLTNPTTFSIELWFKTTTTSGGKVFGFENSRNATSSTNDRHLFMRNDGKLSYGGWSNGGTSMITTTAAYNDGKWHHVVVTARPISGSSQQSSNVYVDGVRVATGNTTAVSSYAGYWRAGYGSLPSVTGTPSSPTFEGSIDNFAIYTSELSATKVEIHFASR